MWLNNLKELRKSSGMSLKQIADATKIPESTIKRIFSGDTEDPYLSTIQRIVVALGGTMDNILADTNAVLAPQSLLEVKETARDVEAENADLKDIVAARSVEIERLRLKLEHKDEIIKYKDEIIEHKDKIIELYKYYTSKSGTIDIK